MKPLYIWILLALMPSLSGLYAQNDSVMTLKQCVDFALKNSSSVKNATLDEYIAEAKIKETVAIGLPQITGSAMVMTNPKLKPMFLPPGMSFPGFPPPANPEDVTIIDNIFQTKSLGDAYLSGTQILFSGSYLVGLQATQTYAQLSKKTTQLSKVQVVENVTKAYYMVIIGTEQALLLDANVRRLDSTRSQLRAMNQQGLNEKLDLDRIEVAYNNLIRTRENTKAQLEIGIYALKFQMGYDINKPLIISGNIEDIRNDALSASTNGSADETQRIEYSLLKLKYQGTKLTLKNQRSLYLPSLALFGNAGYTRGDVSVAKVLSNKWYSYGNYGLNLSVPIFSSMNKYYKVQQSKVELKKIENEMSAFSEVVKFESVRAETNLKISLAQVESEKKNVELAREILRVTKIKYEQGVGSNMEMVDAETALKEAETNYFTALYNVAVAKVDYLKATGNLYKE